MVAESLQDRVALILRSDPLASADRFLLNYFLDIDVCVSGCLAFARRSSATYWCGSFGEGRQRSVVYVQISEVSVLWETQPIVSGKFPETQVEGRIQWRRGSFTASGPSCSCCWSLPWRLDVPELPVPPALPDQPALLALLVPPVLLVPPAPPALLVPLVPLVPSARLARLEHPERRLLQPRPHPSLVQLVIAKPAPSIRRPMMSCIRMVSFRVTDLAYRFSAPNTSVVTFKVTKNGAPFDVSAAESVGIYFAPYTGSKFQFEPAAERMSLKGDLAV